MYVSQSKFAPGMEKANKGVQQRGTHITLWQIVCECVFSFCIGAPWKALFPDSTRAFESPNGELSRWNEQTKQKGVEEGSGGWFLKAQPTRPTTKGKWSVYFSLNLSPGNIFYCAGGEQRNWVGLWTRKTRRRRGRLSRGCGQEKLYIFWCFKLWTERAFSGVYSVVLIYNQKKKGAVG